MAWKKDTESTAPIDVHANSGVFTYEGNCLCSGNSGSECFPNSQSFAKIYIEEDTTNFDDISSYGEISMACSTNSCNQDMFTVWYKNGASNNVLNDSSMFEVKNEDECRRIVIAETAGAIKTGTQTFDTSNYVDSGYPKIRKSACLNIGDKYIAGTTYSGHKIKYLPRSGETAITSSVFSSNADVVELYFPDNAKGPNGESRNIKTIGSSAFRNLSSLSAVTFGGVETINTLAFADLSYLKHVDFGSTCHASSSNIKFIGSKAFEGCSGITSICLNILNKVTTIGDDAFLDCIGLKSLTLPTSPSYSAISNSCFDNCPIEDTLTIPNNIKVIKEYAFSGHHLQTLNIPKTVTKIEGYAFNSAPNISTTYTLHWYNDDLDSVTFGSNIFGSTSGRNISIIVPSGTKSNYVSKLGSIYSSCITEQ